MSLYLVAPALELSLELNVPESLEQALAIQWERLENPFAKEQFCNRLERQLETLLPGLMDWDIQKPTPSQIAFAKMISAKLGIPVPSEAIAFRGHMHEFLGQNAELFKIQQAALKPKSKS